VPARPPPDDALEVPFVSNEFQEERMSAWPARFQGRVAIVTGGAAGIGASTALRLAGEGAAVAIVDIDEQGRDVAERIQANGGHSFFVHADVTDDEAWPELLDSVHGELGPVGVLVSNAYTVDVTPAGDMTRESWERQLAVNLTGAFLGVRTCLDDLRATSGAVVLISSVHALMGIPGHPAYAAAKAGLTGLGRQLAVEYGPAVRVNTLLPGPILTAAWDRVSPEDRSHSVAATVAKRFGAPEEAAAAVAFLASADASYITGATLVVDGGWSIAKASA
jgi:glucose 1-dehydrogenase